jgi:hypothetical protein
MCKDLNTFHPGGIRIFSSGGGRDDHYYCETAGLTLDEVIDKKQYVSNECISRLGASLYTRRLRHEIQWDDVAARHVEIAWHIQIFLNSGSMVRGPPNVA